MKADFEKGTKVCSKCRRELPVSEFNKNKRNKDGIDNKCRQCASEYYKNNKEHVKTIVREYRMTEKGKRARKRENDKTINTFGRIGKKRGCSGMLKRDYELTEQQFERRNKHREIGKYKTKRTNPHGLLIWYDGKLNNITTEEYRKAIAREYTIQKRCAIRGYIARKQPSEHFLFDFDLEQMLKDDAYYVSGKHKTYIEKWWDGTIRHWTVNDGVWKNKR